MSWDDDADEEWVEDDGEPDDDVLACPSCRRPVHEDAQQCPHCGDWMTPVAPSSRTQRWAWVAVVIVLALCMIVMTVL